MKKSIHEVKMKELITPAIFLLILALISCEKDTISRKNEVTPISKEKISGFVQKGPFINGTSISILELESDLSQTGKTFNTQISDNKGSFEFTGVDLSSQYVELMADGFYFNEIQGVKSTSQLTLYGLTDLTDKNSLNVNVLSHLEKERIKFLISNSSAFEDAKRQAQSEVLSIFSITKSDILESELLDISKEGDGNAILLAVSLILQGYRTDAELSELLANIVTDIREDGQLNDTVLGTELINHARLLDLARIRNNLTERYQELGIEVTIADFEKYVELFLENSPYEITNLIEYPEFSDYGENILFEGKIAFQPGHKYSLAASLPVGTEVKVVMSGGLWYYEVLPNGPKNWTVSQYDEITQTQTFTSTEPGKDCDLKIEFVLPYTEPVDSIFSGAARYAGDTITIDYFENGAQVPTSSKRIYIEN